MILYQKPMFVIVISVNVDDSISKSLFSIVISVIFDDSVSKPIVFSSYFCYV